MSSVCEQCHSETWVDNYYENADATVKLYNKKYADSSSIVDGLREDGLLTEQDFDEPVEFKIYEFWHHEGRRARMGAFMMGPDYVQWHGFYELLKDKAEIVEMAEQIRLNAEIEADLGIGASSERSENDTKTTPGLEAWVLVASILSVVLIMSGKRQ